MATFRCLSFVLLLLLIISTTVANGKLRASPDKQVYKSENQEDTSNANRVLYRNRRDAPDGIKKFREDILAEHNKYRNDHGVGPLQLTDELNNMAQKYADHLAEIGKTKHSGAAEVGENLFQERVRGDGMVSASSVVKAWYEEIKDYNFDQPENNAGKKGIGHFTQVVWKGTTELGVGYGKKDNTVYVVANYKPPGCIKGGFAENVPKKTQPSNANNIQVKIALLFSCILFIRFMRHVSY